MEIRFTDFNSAGDLLGGALRDHWGEIEEALVDTPPHFKASDQRGLLGNPIFDPVGTNQAIHDRLTGKGWQSGIQIPAGFRFLGTDVDYGKGPTLVEVQFSNYPFLLNNTLRSELFYKSQVPITGAPTAIAIIVTKARMFPASNSTLYYEQAQQQLSALSAHSVFDVPIRLVGLFTPTGRVPAVWTDYDNPRYSRTVVQRRDVECMVGLGHSDRSRAAVHVLADR